MSRFLPSKNLLLFTLAAALGTALSFLSYTTAATPNPGHPWSEVGDGWFAATGTSQLRTFSFPDADAAVLTDASAVSAAQGGTGLDASSAPEGALLVGDGSGFSLATLAGGTNVSVSSGPGSVSVGTVDDPTFADSVTTPSLDSAATLAVGGSSASSLTLGRGGLTTQVAGALSVGGGTAVTRHLSATQANVTSASITCESCDDYATVTVTGAAVGDTVVATPEPATNGIEDSNLFYSAAVTSANTVTIRACNPNPPVTIILDLICLSPVNTDNTQTWHVDVWQH